MILLTKFVDGTLVGIPPEDIKAVDIQGELRRHTWIKLANGDNYCIKETVEEVVRMVNEIST